MQENPYAAALARVLPAELCAETVGGRVQVSYSGVLRWLQPIWIGEGFPADARRGLKIIQATREDEIPVLIARLMSNGSQEMLADLDTSWADLSGRAVISIDPGIFISRLAPTGPAPRSTMRWSATVSATAEVLLQCHLENRDRDAAHLSLERPRQIAARVGVSYAQVSKILSQFDAQGYTAKVGPERGPTAGRVFREPGQLLSDWAGNYGRSAGQREEAQFHVPWREPARTWAVVSELLSKTRPAASGAYAADQIAPFLTQYSDLLVYVGSDDFTQARRSLLEDEDISEVEAGGRLFLRPANDYLLELSDEQGSARLVSAVRIYADLLTLGGRAGEAAEQLRESAIGF